MRKRKPITLKEINELCNKHNNNAVIGHRLEMKWYKDRGLDAIHGDRTVQEYVERLEQKNAILQKTVNNLKKERIVVIWDN